MACSYSSKMPHGCSSDPQAQCSNPGPSQEGSKSHLLSFLVSVGNTCPAFAAVFVQESER